MNSLYICLVLIVVNLVLLINAGDVYVKSGRKRKSDIIIIAGGGGHGKKSTVSKEISYKIQYVPIPVPMPVPIKSMAKAPPKVEVVMAKVVPAKAIQAFPIKTMPKIMSKNVHFINAMPMKTGGWD